MTLTLRTYIRQNLLMGQHLFSQGHVVLGSLEQANVDRRKHQCALKLASWGYYKNQSRGRPRVRTPLRSPVDTVPPFAKGPKLSTLEETPPSSNEKSQHPVDGGGSPIEQSSDEDMESTASDSTEETEEQDVCLDDTSGLKLPKLSTFWNTYDSGEGPPTSTSSRYSLSTISELDKDELGRLLFGLDSDQDMLLDTASDETALFHHWNNLHPLETRSPVATVVDQSSKATHQNHHLSNASTPLDVLPVSAVSSAVSEPRPPALSLERRNVPPALLQTSASIRPVGVLLPNDLNQMENLARLFSASGASNIAFRIHHMVLHHVLATLGKNQITPQLFRLAINLTKNATTKAHFGVVSDLIKKTILKRCDFLSPTTLEACVLHSYLGNSFRQRKDIRAAYKHCRLALEVYQSIPQEMRKNGSEIVLATHFDMVLEAKVSRTASIDLGELLATFQEASGAECALEPEHGPMLERLADWCKTVLTDSDFLAVVEESPEELWEMAPTAKDFAQLEATILFWCFCLKYWREEQDNDNSPPSRDGRVPLAHLEQQLGIDPHDSLFTMAGLLLNSQFSHRDSNERRSKQSLVNDTQNLAVQTFKTPTASFHDFIAAYSSTIRTECRRFSTESFQAQVRDYLCTFTESRIMLNLSEYAFRDARFPARPPSTLPSPPSQLSTSLPPTTTQLPSPRSSWSGFASIASLAKNKNRISTPNTSDSTLPPTAGLRLSTGSSSFRQRFSLGGSAKRLSGSSAKDVDSVDILVQE
jgi:hypothetical protein